MFEHTCQGCGNTTFSENASHCKMCGAPTQNTCTNDECGDLNEIDAAYCEYCGSETVYNHLGIVKKVDLSEMPF